MSYETILLDQRDGVATITLNRPEKLNAYTPTMRLELIDAWKAVEADPAVRVVVLTGAGRAFCAGADLHGFNDAIDGKEAGLTTDLIASPASNAPLALHNITKPTIASLRGAAVGVGFTIALACDIRLAAEDARLGTMFTQVGVVPEFGASYYLPRLVGMAKACELAFTSRIIDAQEALAIGLVNQVLPAEELESATRAMAERIASLPALAIRFSKRLLYQGLDNDLATQVQQESLALDYCFKSADHAEAVKAFLEKRPPKFTGR